MFKSPYPFLFDLPNRTLKQIRQFSRNDQIININQMLSARSLFRHLRFLLKPKVLYSSVAGFSAAMVLLPDREQKNEFEQRPAYHFLVCKRCVLCHTVCFTFFFVKTYILQALYFHACRLQNQHRGREICHLTPRLCA